MKGCNNMKIIKKILPHILIILGGMFLTFTVLNHFNDAMNFINNEISITLIFVWAVLSMVMGGIAIADNIRSGNKSNKATRTDKTDEQLTKPTGAQRYKRSL